MSKIQLRISDLRKKKQMKQNELANQLGVSVQTVSKWENDISMPDISLLPDIAAAFQVSVDELLGLKPLSDEEYIPVRSDEKGYWDSRLEYLKASRKSFWNEDYLQFLIEKVWKIHEPVQMLDCGCGFGYMGAALLPFLPEGSAYTGIDFTRNMIDEGERLFREAGYQGTFICDDFRTHEFRKQYDVVISQSTMRHAGKPQAFLRKMIALARSGGLVVAADVNREFESDGFYVEGLDYQELCARNGFRKMWQKELLCQDRDYAIGIRLPFMMRQEGLLSVDVRMNDRISFVSPDNEDYEESVENLLAEKKWDKTLSTEAEEEMVQTFLNHGMDRKEAESYCRKQRKIESFMRKNKEDLTYLQWRGLVISYGWKK
ncbi:MAG: methyltransferase domain-containing protein [Bacillus sp. (in: Bacteria)]|nr:methyltransferase domain-containing protein [Bacillus sp. (in: firmicutes)]MCM1426637.1 methyltransferase domain-containing protein [Eubacterium sp.]